MARVLFDKEIDEIRRLYSEKGLTADEIADKVNTSQSTVSNVVRGIKRYSHLEPVKRGERVGEVKEVVEEKSVEEPSAFDDVGKVDEQVELMREKEQMEGIRELKESRDVANRAMVNLRNALVANQKTCGMLTEAMLKLDERVVRIERLLSKAAKG